ncbi:MAG TPA: hypothetical protein VE998_01980 [Terriglobales bacterium]|nr:hypothetical protein [Terriglobales bacterium]
MKTTRVLIMYLLLALLALGVAPAAFSQSPSPAPAATAYSLTLNAVGLPGGKQSVPGTDAGFLFGVTQNASLRSDNILAPGNGFQAYLGGVQYRLNFLAKALENASPQLDGSHFQFSAHASIGVDRVSNPAGQYAQHYAVMAGFRGDYDPSGSGKFSVNLFDISYAKFPGWANNVPVISLGMKFWP